MNSLSIIMPIHNEERALAANLRFLLHDLPSDAELVAICNGCSDGSAAYIHGIGDRRIRLIVLPDAGKAAAIRVGEHACTAFPRFFVDADVRLSGADIVALAYQLEDGVTDLVSPRLVFDLRGGSFWTIRANRLWLALPHGRTGAFQQVIGVTRTGRAGWDELPDVTADDSYMLSRIPPERTRIVAQVQAVVRPPATLAALVGVRLRILKGLRELGDKGIARPSTPGQGAALRRAFLDPRHMAGATAYMGVGLVARALFLAGFGRSGWFRDESSRVGPAEQQP